MYRSKEAKNRGLKLAKFVVRRQVEVGDTLIVSNLITSRKGKWIREKIAGNLGEWDVTGFQDG
jgi:hypothetical protein